MLHEDKNTNKGDGLVVKGVYLPRNVVIAFKEANLDPEAHSVGELELAVKHGADGEVFQDKNGVSLADKLVKTPFEKQRETQAEQEKQKLHPEAKKWAKCCPSKKGDAKSYREMLEEEEECHGHGHNLPRH